MKRPERAMQIWSLLICAARERKSYTYGDLAEILSMGGESVFSQTLGILMKYCDTQNYPPLTILVVKKKTGVPGGGLYTIDDVNSDREKVFQFDWFKITPPNTSDFEGL